VDTSSILAGEVNTLTVFSVFVGDTALITSFKLRVFIGVVLIVLKAVLVVEGALKALDETDCEKGFELCLASFVAVVDAANFLFFMR
jgi:hypothetical protein